MVVHYESYRSEESSPRAALVLVLPPLNQDVSAMEEFRVDRLLQMSHFLCSVKISWHSACRRDRGLSETDLAF